MATTLYPIYHRPCRSVLFYYNEKPVIGEPIITTLVTVLNGTMPEVQQTVFCKECGVVKAQGDMVINR